MVEINRNMFFHKKKPTLIVLVRAKEQQEETEICILNLTLLQPKSGHKELY